MPSKILITMDDLETAVRLNAALEAAGHRTAMVAAADDARQAMRRETPDLVVLTGAVYEPPARQLAALARDAEISTLALLEPTDQHAGEREPRGVDVTEIGIKPIAPADAVHLVERLLARRALQQRTGIMGESAPIQELLIRLEQMAPVSSTVLIQGESGSGKELVAKAIHDLSPRRGKPFIAVNCAALPETLLESELFGHVKGAFTGANTDRKGLFEIADQGTLFLDEIGDMPLTMQAKLLRVIEDGVVIPVGSNKPTVVDVRIISATNQNLRKLIEQNRFREDLYFRIRGVEMSLPPLRDRPEDIPLLARHFLDEAVGETGSKVTGITEAAMRVLTTCEWPGNIRQLKNTIRTMVVMCDRDKIDVPDLPPEIAPRRQLMGAGGPPASLAGVSLNDLERKAILDTLARTEGNREKAARILGIGERTLYRKIREYNL